MRRNRIWISALATVIVAGSASATPIVTDGDWSDWFSYGGNVAHNTWHEGSVTLTDTDIRTQNDEEGPTPGLGGQLYDIEQIFYYYDDADPNNPTGGTLHLGLVTGFPAGGDPVLGYYAGDLFLNYGNSADYTHAVAVGTENTPENDNGNRFGDAWGNLGWTEIAPALFPGSGPYRVDETLGGVLPLAGVSVAWGGQGLHNFLEVTLDVDGGAEEILAAGGFSIHWTMGCGNDVIDVVDPVSVVPLIPVPEPATMVLLGMGVLGIALRSRRPTC